jgi:hypothetical protein
VKEGGTSFPGMSVFGEGCISQQLGGGALEVSEADVFELWDQHEVGKLLDEHDGMRRENFGLW